MTYQSCETDVRYVQKNLEEADVINQRVQPQNTKKQQSMAAKATDSNTVTKVHKTSSIANSNHLKLCRLHPVVKYEKSNSGHRKMDDGRENPNPSHRKDDVYHIGHISLPISSYPAGRFFCISKGYSNVVVNWGGILDNYQQDIFLSVGLLLCDMPCHLYIRVQVFKNTC